MGSRPLLLTADSHVTVVIMQLSPAVMQYCSLLLSLLSSLSLAQNSISDGCRAGEQCVGIRTCPAVVEQLTEAKATQDPDTRDQIIREVRDKVCGERKERKVCCQVPEATGFSDSSEPAGSSAPKTIGNFINIFHDIAGTAYAVDDRTILIKDFTYDGQGPDAFFLAGTKGRPSKSGEVVLPYPYEGKTFDYRDKDIPILGRFTGDKDIMLTLPPGKTVDQLKWISVWCRDFTVNFGHVTFPSNFSL